MKYIRTKNSIEMTPFNDAKNSADTIEALVDGFIVVIEKDNKTKLLEPDTRGREYLIREARFWASRDTRKVYGGIWTTGEKGEPIFKAITKPMSTDGKLELLEE